MTYEKSSGYKYSSRLVLLVYIKIPTRKSPGFYRELFGWKVFIIGLKKCIQLPVPTGIQLQTYIYCHLLISPGFYLCGKTLCMVEKIFDGL